MSEDKVGWLALIINIVNLVILLAVFLSQKEIEYNLESMLTSRGGHVVDVFDSFIIPTPSDILVDTLIAPGISFIPNSGHLGFLSHGYLIHTDCDDINCTEIEKR